MKRIESFEDGRKEVFSVLREQKVSVTHNGRHLARWRNRRSTVVAVECSVGQEGGDS